MSPSSAARWHRHGQPGRRVRMVRKEGLHIDTHCFGQYAPESEGLVIFAKSGLRFPQLSNGF